MSDRPTFSAGSSKNSETLHAIEEASARALAELDGPPDLAFVFVSHHHHRDFEELAGRIVDRTQARHLLGATGESIVAGGEEIESGPALSLWLARLPGVSVQSFVLDVEMTVDGPALSGWPDELLNSWPSGATLFVLGEPHTFPADDLLSWMNEEHPGAPMVGGMASGGSPGANRLFWGPRALAKGAVAALLSGPISVKTVVSQGCRPIGRPFVITKAKENMIEQLGGKPALAQLQEMLEELPSRDQYLIQHGLHVGRVINEYQESFHRGDFLVRNVAGASSKTGAIAIGDYVRSGQTVQFHVRDEATADEDLRELLASAPRHSSSAALLFTCNGRGTRLFSEPHHDARAIRDALGNIPLAGFFAAGEIGPIGKKNFLHGFTASVAIFGPPPSEGPQPSS